MYKNECPIGVFDSGIGGLSILSEIHSILPYESLIYLADNKHLPYGEKPAEYILARCKRIITFFITHKVKALVLACNTATCVAAGYLRYLYPDLLIISIYPAIKSAVKITRNGRIGILATSRTLKSVNYIKLINNDNIKIFTQACTGLVELIEKLDLASTYRLLEYLLSYILENNCDTLILGCTHYYFIKPLLNKIIPKDIIVIDTHVEISTKLSNKLYENNLLAKNPNNMSCVRFFSTSYSSKMMEYLLALWKTKEPLIILDI